MIDSRLEWELLHAAQTDGVLGDRVPLLDEGGLEDIDILVWRGTSPGLAIWSSPQHWAGGRPHKF